MEKKHLLIFVSLFFLVRILYVSFPIYSMSLPRMGDDALTYQWKGILHFSLYDSDKTAVEDVKNYHKVVDPDFEKFAKERPDWWKNRVLMRAYGTYSSWIEMFFGALHKLGIHSKYSFWLFELLGTFVFVLGFLMLSRMIDSNSIIFSSILFAFILGPVIPAIMCLSLSLIMLSLSYEDKFKYTAYSFLSFFIAGAHPFGVFYLTAIFGSRFFYKKRFKELFKMLIPMGFALLGLTFNKFFPWIESLPPYGTGKLSLSWTVFVDNLLTGLNAFVNFFYSYPIILLILIYGFLTLDSSYQFKRIKYFVYVTLIGAFFTLFHDIKGHPGIAFQKAIIPFFSLLCIIAGSFCFQVFRENRVKKKVLVSLLALHVVWGGYSTFKDIFRTINGRSQIVHEEKLKKVFEVLPDDSQLLYLDSDVALMYSYMNGGLDFPTIPFSFVKYDKKWERFISKEKVDFVVTSIPLEFNFLSKVDSYSLGKRFHGLKKNEQSLFEVVISEDIAEPIFLKIGKYEKSLELDSSCENIESQVVKGWHKIQVGSDCKSPVTLRVQGGQFKVTGLNIGSIKKNLNWPWGDKRITLNIYEKEKHLSKLQFSWPYLLEQSRAKELINYFETMEPISDESGVLFIKI